MNKKALSSGTRVLGFVPKGERSYVLVESRVRPSVDVPGEFRGDGVEIQFDGGEQSQGLSLWLTLADTKELAAHLQGVIDRLSSWPLP